jgi:hypothetical protein
LRACFLGEGCGLVLHGAVRADVGAAPRTRIFNDHKITRGSGAATNVVEYRAPVAWPVHDRQRPEAGLFRWKYDPAPEPERPRRLVPEQIRTACAGRHHRACTPGSKPFGDAGGHCFSIPERESLGRAGGVYAPTR